MKLPQLKADSVAALTGIRVTTYLVEVPTVKLAELRTHRLFVQTDDVMGLGSSDSYLSLNANSSRAIPADRLAARVNEDPYEPLWTAEQKGMSGAPATEDQCLEAGLAWDDFRYSAYDVQLWLKRIGIHKQETNLVLHPWSWSVCVITADHYGWDNWFRLRCADGVYPAIRRLAEQIREIHYESTPTMLYPGEWHIPFIEQCPDPLPTQGIPLKHLAVSGSCCARISYNNDTTETYETHLKRAKRCVELKHNVFEHQLMSPYESDLAEMGVGYELVDGYWNYKRGSLHSNIAGWVQARKLIEQNAITL